MHVNLLPFAFQRKLMIHQLVRKWTATWLICLIAISLFIAFRYSEVVRQRQELLGAEVHCASTRAVVASNLQLESSLAGLQATRNQLSRLEPDKDALAALAIVAQAVHATQGRAQIDNLQFHEPKHFSVAPPAATPGTAVAQAGGTITLHGIAADDEVVAAIIESVGRISLMRKVELRSSSAVEANGLEGRRFEIVCRY